DEHASGIYNTGVEKDECRTFNVGYYYGEGIGSLVFNTLVIYLLPYYNSSIQASKLTNENLNLNSPVPLISEQTSDSISINNKQLSNSVIDISESFLPIPIPESGMLFKSWTELDRYIDAYCNSKNFSKVIYGAEYDNGI
ncbi:24461_t:CDS:2, partial [Dentiscutata erythropus]